MSELLPIKTFQVDSLECRVFETRSDLGQAASAHVAAILLEKLGSGSEEVRIAFAAAPSQDEFLSSLAARRDIDWSKIVAFHMDEYLGIGAAHPASFRRYLRERLFSLVGIGDDRRRLIPGELTESPLRVCLAYEEALRSAPPHLVCAGIGENGHLAFNDPPTADFADPLWVKVVKLDKACREQQLHDGCFESINDVPTHAYTLTLPALLAAEKLSVVVPGPRKADAILAALEGPIDEACPASALRTHEGAVLFLDRDSAAKVV